MHFLYRSDNFWKAPWMSSCVSESMTFLTYFFNSSSVSQRQPLSLGKTQKSQVWTVGRVRNCLDTHLGQIVCDKDGVVNWCIVLVEMSLTRFEECWPLPVESLPELPQNLKIVTLTLTLWPINSGVVTSLLLPHLSSSLGDSLPSLNALSHSKTDARFMQDALKQSEAFHTFLWHNFYQV